MTGADVLDSRYAWMRPGISLLIAVVGNVGMWAIVVVMPAVQAEFGVDRADAALPCTLTMVGFAVGNLVVGRIVDRFGVTLALIGSELQCLALFFYLPFDGMMSLYIVSTVFGLAQGGIVPSYALVVREYMPSEEAGRRVGFVMMATIFGMAIGGWMSGWIYDVTGSYQMAFVNGIAWNFVNIAIMTLILLRARPRGPGPAAA